MSILKGGENVQVGIRAAAISAGRQLFGKIERNRERVTMLFVVAAAAIATLATQAPGLVSSAAAQYGPDLQGAAVGAATDGVTAGVAVAVVILGGVLVYRIAKRFFS